MPGCRFLRFDEQRLHFGVPFPNTRLEPRNATFDLRGRQLVAEFVAQRDDHMLRPELRGDDVILGQLGIASCRVSGCQSVSVAVVPGSVKKKNTISLSLLKLII